MNVNNECKTMNVNVYASNLLKTMNVNVYASDK